jgi:hypothetical protein
MILWQFIVLMIFLAVCQWAAETRDSKRNELLNRLLQRLSEIEGQLGTSRKNTSARNGLSPPDSEG